MKKILLFLILTTLTNISYASFPSIDTLTSHQDTVKSETTLEYHQRMKAMGFNIANCLCTDCQKFKGEAISIKKTSSPAKKITTTLLNIGFFLLISILIIGLYSVYLIMCWISSI